MRTFYIYPIKSNDAPIQLKFQRFIFTGDRFVLFDYADKASSLGYLNADNVAAIHIPSKASDHERQYPIPRIFHVHLLGRPNPLEVYAHYFQVSDSQLEFFTKYPAHREHSSTTISLKNEETYIKLSEVVAVIPSDGLEYFRS